MLTVVMIIRETNSDICCKLPFTVNRLKKSCARYIKFWIYQAQKLKSNNLKLQCTNPPQTQWCRLLTFILWFNNSKSYSQSRTAFNSPKLPLHRNTYHLSTIYTLDNCSLKGRVKIPPIVSVLFHIKELDSIWVDQLRKNSPTKTLNTILISRRCYPHSSLSHTTPVLNPWLPALSQWWLRLQIGIRKKFANLWWLLKRNSPLATPDCLCPIVDNQPSVIWRRATSKPPICPMMKSRTM